MRLIRADFSMYALIGALWATGVLLSISFLVDHATSPGIAAACPPSWPTESAIQPAPGEANLVLFAHPHCPCIRATIDELARIMARTDGRVTAHALFVLPVGKDAGWERTDSWDRAASIPGVRVSTDTFGLEAQRFGAVTSGQVVLYDREGARRFAGGITWSRGHAGDNAGSDAILNSLLHGKAVPPNTPVFGCPLFPPTPSPFETDSCCQ